jgi:hypothetical protein
MKERPILFSGPMVRAILDGSKTQTRRVAKEFDEMPNLDGILQRFPRQNGCPHGTPGDRLWVRETWAAFTQPTHEYGESDLVKGPIAEAVETHGPLAYVYKADGNSLPDRWRPSIFMPRIASRILLEITDVRVQRLQEISDEDARAEGIEYSDEYAVRQHAHVGLDEGDWIPNAPPIPSFRSLWDTIHGSGAWHANPWVWAITFQRLEP